MATIKSHTNIPQSRKLSEILPFESADQSYIRVAIAGDNLNIPEEMQYKHNGDMPFVICNGVGIPCWSLAALLSVLPDIHLKKYTYDGITRYYTTLVGIRQFNSEHYDNPIDACVEMIIKLHERKML